MFSAIPTEAEPAAAVIAELNAKLGMTGPVVQNLAKPLLEMTRLLGGDAKQNAEQFSEIIGKWDIPVAEGALALDKLFVAAQGTGVGVDTLMQQLLRFGAPLQQFGFSFEAATALLAEFERSGVNTEQAMAGMTKALGAFAKAGKDPEQALNDLVKQIKGAGTETEATKLAVAAFGAKAGPELASAIREGRLSVDGLAAAMAGAEGAIMKTAAATADFPEKFQVLKNKVTTLLMPLGSIMVSGLTAAVDAIGPAIDSAMAWIQKIGGEGTKLGALWQSLQTLAQTIWPGLRDTIAESMRVVGAIIVDYVVPALTDIFTWLSVNLPPAIQAASDFFNNTLLPALTAVGVFIRDNVIPVLMQVITWLATNLPPAIQAAANFFNNTLLPALTAIAVFIRDNVIPVFLAVNNWLGTTLGPLIAIARAAFEEVLLPILTLLWDILVQKVIPAIEKLNTWLGTTIIGAIAKAKQAFAELKGKLDPVLSVIKDIVSWISGRLQPTINAFKDFIGGIHFGNPFEGLLDTIRNIIDRISDAIAKLRELLGLTGGTGRQCATASAVRVCGLAPVGSAVGTAGSVIGGNTYYFNFAAPATAYDERRVEAAVERAMLNAGVRADNRQRTR